MKHGRMPLAVGLALILGYQGIAFVLGPPQWSIAPKEPLTRASIATPAPLPDGGREFTVASAASLLRLYERAAFDLAAVRGGDSDVPRLYLAQLPADITGLEQIGPRKRAFLRIALPLVLRVNAEIAIERTRAAALLERLADDGALTRRDRRWLTATARRYGVLDSAGGDLDEALDADARQALLRRMDGVPVALALAQAIVESGWGRSRFAREGNALFGQWTWDKSQGIAPAGAPDAEHAVKAFESLSHSVRGYMHNLNTHPAYAEFRAARANGASARALALTLTEYSERGAVYGEDLVEIIVQNSLDDFASARLGATNIRRGDAWRRLEAAPRS